MNIRTIFGLFLLAVIGATTACDSTPSASEDTARIQILLTDAPVDYLEEAWVSISRVYLIPGEEEPEEGPPFIDLFHDEDDPRVYDLLTLQDGVVADLTGEVEVPAGTYRQLRMIVDDATVVLRDGYQFNDGSTEKALMVPSGAQTGIKVMLEEAITTEGGTINVILVDFDVNENFVLQGNPESPAGLQGILFTPVLREIDRNVNDG